LERLESERMEIDAIPYIIRAAPKLKFLHVCLVVHPRRENYEMVTSWDCRQGLVDYKLTGYYQNHAEHGESDSQTDGLQNLAGTSSR